jgi:hypothetical protein
MSASSCGPEDEPGLLQLHPYDGLPALKLHHNGLAITVEPN